MSERMDRKKGERRNQILDVAEKIVAEKGINGMTMDDVAREADIATGTLYLYFKNKNSLCAAVSLRIQKLMSADTAARAALCETASGRLRASGMVAMEFAGKNPEKRKALKQLSYLDFSDSDDENVKELLEMDNQSVHWMAQCYRDGIAEGDIRPDIDPVTTAIFQRYSLSLVFDPLPRMRALIRMNGIGQDHWVAVTTDLMSSSTHLKKPINRNVEADSPAEKKRRQSKR